MSGIKELRYLKGVGGKRADALKDAGIEGIDDLLSIMPFRWEDRRAFATVSKLVPGGAEATLDLRVVSSRLIRTRRRGFTIFHAVLADATGNIKAIWYNQPYLLRVFVPDARVVVFGRATLDRRTGRDLVLENPDYERIDPDEEATIHTGRIVPVYRKLGTLTSRALRATIWHVLQAAEESDVPPILPDEVRREQEFPTRLEALRWIHFPAADATMKTLEERRTPAQRALAFEEIFVLQLALAERRRAVEKTPRAASYEIPDALRVKLAKLLPFKLTEAQKRVLLDIKADLTGPHPMNRLLQGDVGSGKTIVALLALLVAVENGYQGALMAPTEILADQHARNVIKLLGDAGSDVKVVVLMGSQKAAAKRRALEDIATGRGQIVIGTHALFEGGVAFKRLGLVVVDEQHRFGVLQRLALASKGDRPDLLVMTATPIPRSLALTLYGDLDLSVIDELPPGRTPIKTVVRFEHDRPKVYDGIRKEVAAGRQAYVVVPLVEETAASDLKAATAFAEHLSKRVFPKLNVGLLHGRLKSEEKERVMADLVRGAIQVLVATTVVEVGVDVPNASVMVVEHAERFGLSQLHQLRGRVGRGAARSYCVLMVGEEAGDLARERLSTMEATSDGFKIAERDLDLRGAGVVFGTQQHGASDLQFLADVLKNPRLIDDARNAARALAQEGKAASILGALKGSWKTRLLLPGAG
ncbi:MAG TPA: ATP-dependent DNA helicase RecG [Candidatus Polarisedimenticolaceae bacterium]|nr:ATP-dependent DNA helicase RecG [Candidatus Polarisedimenticolaceae bacterium]